jgi:hypothetical protein
MEALPLAEVCLVWPGQFSLKGSPVPIIPVHHNAAVYVRLTRLRHTGNTCRNMGFGRRSAIDNRRLRAVSGRLGDAAIDPSIWPELMEEICTAVGSTGAMLLQSDVRTPDVPRTASIDEALRAYFGGAFHLADVRAERGVPLLLTGSPVAIDQDFVTPDDIRSDAMYNEVLIPLGLQWFAGVGFRAETALWVLCIQRTIAEGPFENSDKRILATLSHRLTEVATLSTMVGRIALSSATDALGAVDQAAVSIDRFGLLLDSNEAATDLFDSELCIRNRRLFVANPRSSKLVRLMFDRLRNTPDTLPFTTPFHSRASQCSFRGRTRRRSSFACCRSPARRARRFSVHGRF